MKVGHFGNFFSKGVRLEFFFANRVRKKKFFFFLPKNGFFFPADDDSMGCEAGFSFDD